MIRKYEVVAMLKSFDQDTANWVNDEKVIFTVTKSRVEADRFRNAMAARLNNKFVVDFFVREAQEDPK